MKDFYNRAWTEINLNSLLYNMETIRQQVRPETMIMGVVKADAYGHGSKQIAVTLQNQGLVSWFGVARYEEALLLRDAGVVMPILIFGITPAKYADTLLHYELVPTVHTLAYAKELQAEAETLGKIIPVHIKIDTGMSRMGILTYDDYEEEGLSIIEGIASFKNLSLQGMYTHFAVSDTYNEPSTDFTKLQFNRYQETRKKLEQRGITFQIYHCSNSAAIVSYPEMNLDMVRAGVIIYGMHPSEGTTEKMNLKPIMSFLATIMSVKEIPIGATVSYGREFTAERVTRIANVGVGYADGYDRIFSKKGIMLVQGKRVPVLGRVCMDQLMLDVTDIPEVKAGDTVTIAGTDGNERISFEELAQMTNTINYEKTSMITKRVPRVYDKDGEIVEVMDLLRGQGSSFEGEMLHYKKKWK